MSMTRSLLMPSKTKLTTQSGTFTAEVRPVQMGGGGGQWAILLVGKLITFPKAFRERPEITVSFTNAPGQLINLAPKCTVTPTTISWPTHQIGQTGGPVHNDLPGTWTATGYV